MRKVISFLVGMLMGGLVGSTLALLLTPASGEELRLRIQDRYQQVQDEVKQAAADRRYELESQLETMRARR